MKPDHAPDKKPAPKQGTAQGGRDQLEQRLFVALARIRQLEQELAETQSELQLVYGSTSWRLTYPLRQGVHLARGLSRLPRQSGPMLVALSTRFPRLRGFLIRALDRFPALRERLRRNVMPSLVSDWSEQAYDFSEHMTEEQLPPSARALYRELRRRLSGEWSS